VPSTLSTVRAHDVRACSPVCFLARGARSARSLGMGAGAWEKPGTMADSGARSDAGSGKSIGLADRITLGPAEAAAVLGVSERTFRSLLPRLPHFREGNVVLIPVAELRRWASDRARGALGRS